MSERSSNPADYWSSRSGGSSSARDTSKGSAGRPYASSGGMPRAHSPIKESFRSSTHRFSGSYSSGDEDYSPRKSQPRRPRSRAPSPELAYTFKDEEPEFIDIAPAAWNNFTTRATRGELKKFFVGQGMDKETVETELNKEFEARAPKYSAGRSRSSSSKPHPEPQSAGYHGGPSAYEVPPKSSKPKGSRPRARSQSPSPKRKPSFRSDKSRPVKDFVRGMAGMGFGDHKDEDKNTSKKPHRPSRSNSTRQKPADSHETEVKSIMDRFEYIREDAEDFLRSKEIKLREEEQGKSTPPKPAESYETEIKSVMNRFNYSRENAEEFFKFKEKKLREEKDGAQKVKSKDEEGFRKFRERKAREASSVRPSSPPLHRSSSSHHKSSSPRSFLDAHAKAYRNHEITPDEWKTMWIKPHLNKGRSRDEAVTRAEKELANAVCEIMRKRYTDRGMSGAEAEKKLDALFSKPVKEGQYA